MAGGEEQQVQQRQERQRQVMLRQERRRQVQVLLRERQVLPRQVEPARLPARPALGGESAARLAREPGRERQRHKQSLQTGQNGSDV